MSELQSFFASDSEYSEDEAQTSADLPRRVADAAASGDIDTIRRYVNAPRLDVVVLQALCAKGRAAPYRSSRLSPPVLARLFPTSTKSPHIPREIFWRILQFWRTDRDP